MSASSGNTSNNKSKTGDVKPGGSYNVLNINDLYRGKSLEPKPTGSVAKHGMQTIGKIKNLTRIPPPDNAPTVVSVVKEKENSSVSVGENSNSQGWTKTESIVSDSTLNRTQVTSDSYPRASSASNLQSVARGVTAPVGVSATSSPGAPWSGDAPCGLPASYLNPEFPDLDSAISDSKQPSLKSGPQLRPQVPLGANWTQGMASVGNQQQSGGNGANGKFGLHGDQRSFPPVGVGRAPELNPNLRPPPRNSDLKNVGVLSPSKIEELDKIATGVGQDWCATQDFDYNQTIEFDYDDDFMKKKKEKEAADLQLINSDRPKVEGPHRPLFDPNDSKTSNAQTMRSQEPVKGSYSKGAPIDDRGHKSGGQRSDAHQDTRQLPYGSYGGKQVQQLPPRFQKLHGQQQQHRAAEQAKPNIVPVVRETAIVSQDSRRPIPSHAWKSTDDRGNAQHKTGRDIIEKPIPRVDDKLIAPVPIGNWADIMDNESEKKNEPRQDSKVKSIDKVNRPEPDTGPQKPSEVKWPRSGKLAEAPSAVPLKLDEPAKDEPVKIIAKPVIPVKKEEVKNDLEISKKTTVASSVEVQKVVYGPPPSKPAFVASQTEQKQPKRQDQSVQNHREQPTDGKVVQHADKRNQYHDYKGNQRPGYPTGTRRADEQAPRFRRDNHDPRQVTHDDSKFQNQGRHNEARRPHNDDRPHYHDNRQKTGQHEDKKTGRKEDRRPSQYDDRYSNYHEGKRSYLSDRRPVHHDERKPSRNEVKPSYKPVSNEPDTGTEIWETASENSHKEDKKQDYKKDSKEHRKHDKGDGSGPKPRSESNRDSDMNWKPRTDIRDKERSHERDSNFTQRKYSDSRGDQNRKKDEKDNSRRSSKDSSTSNEVTSATQSMSKMSLKDKTGHHEGELSDDGFQRVDRSKKRAKTSGELEASQLKKHSKSAPRKLKPDMSSTKLDKLSEEAFCHKEEVSGKSTATLNAWIKPLNQVPPLSASGIEIGKIRNTRISAKLGSFEHQDSGVDINSDQPTSTTSSQRSSPGDHARRAGLTTSTRTITQTTSVTVPKTLPENVDAEESSAHVGTVIFVNRNLKAENEALNTKRRPDSYVPHRQVTVLPETRRAITGSTPPSSSVDRKVSNDNNFEIGTFDPSQAEKLDDSKGDLTPNSTQDLDQKIASVKKVWEDHVPSIVEQEDIRPIPSLFTDSSRSKSPPRQPMNPSLAPGYKMQTKQVAVAYPMTSSANMTPSPPVVQPSQISSPPLDPLRQSMMGYPGHVSTPPSHMYNTQAANFYQQFGQHMYPFSGHPNAMTHAFSHVLNQGFPNMMPQQTNQYQNPANHYQMQLKDGQMQQGNSMTNPLPQNNSYFHQGPSFYQQQSAMQQPQSQQPYCIPGQQSALSYRQPQQTIPRNQTVDSSNGSPNVMRGNNQVVPSNNSLYNSAEVFQKLFLQHQHQAMSQAATAIVGRGQGNKIQQAPNQVGSYNAQNFQQRPMQMHPSMVGMQRPMIPQTGVQMQASQSMGMGMHQPSQATFPQPIQRPNTNPAGPSSSMTAQYLNKTSTGKHSSLPKGAPGQNMSSQEAAKMREDAIRQTQSFFASTRDPSAVDQSSEPTSLE